MTDEKKTSHGALDASPDASFSLRTHAIVALVLITLVAVTFRRDLQDIVRFIFTDPEAVHAAAFPVLAGILLWRTRDRFRFVGGNAGRAFGLLTVLAALAVLLLAQWPFNFAYPRWIAFPIAVTGCVMIVGGFRWFVAAIPVLMLLVLSIPTGARAFSRLIQAPEQIMLSIAQPILDAWPGVSVTLSGKDLYYASDSATLNTIGLGEPHRGASLFLATASICVFVIFLRKRTTLATVLLLLVATPIVMASANLARILTMGFTTFLTDADPLSATPRLVGTFCSLAFGWVLIAGAGVLLDVLGLGQRDEATPVTDSLPRARTSWRHPIAITGLVLLLASAIGLQSAVGGLERRYTKLPIDPVQPIADAAPGVLPSWRLAESYRGVDFIAGDVETDEIWSGCFRATDPRYDTGEQHSSTFVTYYSDPRAQVTHTPEVCYPQAGLVVDLDDTVPLDVTIPGPDGPIEKTISVRRLRVDQEPLNTVVMYLFWSNGRAYHERERLRFALAIPGDRYTYYSKIEVFTAITDDDTLQTATDRNLGLMRELLPHLIETYYPEVD